MEELSLRVIVAWGSRPVRTITNVDTKRAKLASQVRVSRPLLNTERISPDLRGIPYEDAQS